MLEQIQKELRKEAIRQILDYNPETGEFTWKEGRQAIQVGDTAGGDDGDYIRICINRKRYFAHRLAFLWMNGEFPKDFVDHKDGNKLNNSWSNLRECTTSQNFYNKTIPKANTSGIRGVSYDKLHRQWRAVSTDNGQSIFLGYYDSIEDAGGIALTARLEFHGEFAKLD